jgi:iron complex outermembrane recepter protein
MMRKMVWAATAAVVLATNAQAAEKAAEAAGTSPRDYDLITVEGQRYTATAPGTGSKTNVENKDIPAAIVTVPEAVLRDQGVHSMNDALANASAVAPVFAGGYGVADNYLIRGLPMRFLRDGLPDGPSFMGYRRSLADVSVLEVLKGPGSALYGRAEAGGSVNLITKAPQDEWAGEVGGSIGSRWDSWTAFGDITGPLTNGINARLIGNYEDSDGYRGLKRRITEVLPTVSVKLGEGHELVLDYDYRDSHSVVDNYGIPFTVDGKLADIDEKSRLYSPFNYADQTLHRFTVSDRAQVLPDLQLRAAVIYDTRDIEVARNAGGNILNASGVSTSRNGRTQVDDSEFWTAQAEAVITPTTGAIKHTILLGVEYNSTDMTTVRRNYNLPNAGIIGGRIDAPETAIPTVTTLGFDRRIQSDSMSVYAQEQMDISDVLKLRGGVRYDSVKLVDEGFVGATQRRIAGNPNLFSWQVGAVYEASEQLSFYSGYARGKFVSIQTESTSLTPVPESSSQVEAGIKAEIIPGRLNANLAVFETKRDKYFVTLVPGGNPEPVGKQRSRGVELDVVGSPFDGLSIIGNFAYVDAINRSAALSSVTLLATNQSMLGKRISSTPETSGALWANYTVPQGPLAGLGFGAGVTYKGASYVDSLELLRVPSYTLVRAALSYRQEAWEAQLVVNNLTNRTWYSVPTFIGALPGEPRSVQLSLRARF